MSNATYHLYPPQDPGEFEDLCQMVRELQPRHILEVGSRHGRSLVRLVEAGMPRVERVTVIEMPEGPWGKRGSQESLETLCADLRKRGLEVDLHLIDSHSEEAGALAESLRERVDLIFLDGDHTEAGVRQDFGRFFPCLTRWGLLAMHDIAGHESMWSGTAQMGVHRFWARLGETRHDLACSRLVTPGSRLGIGLVRHR